MWVALFLPMLAVSLFINAGFLPVLMVGSMLLTWNWSQYIAVEFNSESSHFLVTYSLYRTLNQNKDFTVLSLITRRDSPSF